MQLFVSSILQVMYSYVHVNAKSRMFMYIPPNTHIYISVFSYQKGPNACSTQATEPDASGIAVDN
jgi:hypothetical protein